MVFKKKSIEDLRKEISEQKKQISKEDIISKNVSEKMKLQRELFELRNRRLIKIAQKAKRLSKRFGKGILKTGQRAAPIIKKQIKLIREQQLRDEAIERRLSKRGKIKSIKIPRKKKSKKVKSKTKKKSRTIRIEF